MNQTFAYVLQGVGVTVAILIMFGLVYWAYLIVVKDALSLRRKR